MSLFLPGKLSLHPTISLYGRFILSQTTVYWLWVVALTLALLYPAGKLIWVMSVRRLQRKLQRELSAAEIEGQKGRAYFIAILVCAAFSMLFNYRLLNGLG